MHDSSHDTVAHPSCAPPPLPFSVPLPPVLPPRCAPWFNLVVGGLVARQGWGGGRPTLALGPSLREFPHGGADACTPRQGVTLLYGPSICNRSVQMDLRRNQVRRPDPTPGSGTLWVSGECLRDRCVSSLPRWTVCPTRSPSQDTNRSTCRGECSWSGPLATPPGRCHLGPLANGPGRNPAYCLRSGGGDTDTGGGPKPLRSGTSPASFAGSCYPGPPPFAAALVPASQLSSPGASPSPAPLAVLPGSRHVPSAPAVCPCSGVLVSFVFCFFSPYRSPLVSPPGASVCPLPPPTSPCCLLDVLAPFLGGWRRRGWGGGRPCCPSSGVSTSQARRRHEAPHLSLCRGGGLPCGSRRHPTFPAVAPPVVPPLELAQRVLSLGTVVWSVPHPLSAASPPCRGVPGGVRVPLPSSPLSPLSSSLCSTHVAGMTQARRKHRAWLHRWGGGAFPLGAYISPWSGTSPASHAGPCHPRLPPFAAVVVPVFSLSSSGALVCFVRGCCFLFCLHRSPPVSSPGTLVCPLSPPHVPSPPPRCPHPFPWWVGEKGVGGGAPSLSVLRCKHVASTAQARGAALVPLQGRGACRVVPVVALPTLRSLPRCPPLLRLQRRVVPSGTVVWSVRHPLSAASPPCRFVLGRGGRCPPLPSFISHPWGGGGVWGGGRPCRLPFVARMLQARRKHGAGTRSGTRPSAGGGACLVAPVVALSTLRSHPRWSPRWGLHGACPLRARSCGPSRTLLPLPPYPAALSSGGGCFLPPPYPHPLPSGGRGWVGEGGAPMSSPLRCTHVAGRTQARHKHGVRHLAAAGGGFPLGLPALLHGIGSTPPGHQPLLPLGGSRHISAWCSVSRACSLLCPYLLEEVRTRVETDDEEVRAAGRTSRTLRRLLAQSAALVEGRAPVSALNSPGGADCPSSPWCLCIHFRAA